VDLRGADLSEADLSGATLRQVHLDGANLRQTRLQGANLDETVSLTNTQLDVTIVNNETHLPGVVGFENKPTDRSATAPAPTPQ
jgi:uncharacterized protein YjbI with pentapeptide repeats